VYCALENVKIMDNYVYTYDVQSYLDLGLGISAWDDVGNRTGCRPSPGQPRKIFLPTLDYDVDKCRRCNS
jgi:hypothetical protein